MAETVRAAAVTTDAEYLCGGIKDKSIGENIYKPKGHNKNTVLNKRGGYYGTIYYL